MFSEGGQPCLSHTKSLSPTDYQGTGTLQIVPQNSFNSQWEANINKERAHTRIKMQCFFTKISILCLKTVNFFPLFKNGLTECRKNLLILQYCSEKRLAFTSVSYRCLHSSWKIKLGILTYSKSFYNVHY